ncbi:MAG TPA: EutN/CcmL family microcompartment protein [Phycisphaerae bacterium]|nr:EutN/CcmL family microcompartment protein [Phycisphaerae bacterium]
MWIGIVQGSVTATIKHPSMRKGTMLIVQPINPATLQPEGIPQVAVDILGAGAGQRVLLTGDGAGTAAMLGAGKDCPVRLAVGAILTDTSLHLAPSPAS